MKFRFGESMKKRAVFVSFLVLLCVQISGVFAAGPPQDWQEKDIRLRMPNGTTIKGIHSPPGKEVPTRKTRVAMPQIMEDEPLQPAAGGGISAGLIDSPPVDGFIPWIAVTTTDENSGELELVAVAETGPVSPSLTTASDPNTAVVGIFDTGASAHVFSNAAGNTLNLFSQNLVTDNSLDISGVTGSVSAWVSYPIGVYIDGLANLIPTGLTTTAEMVGQTNVSVIVGKTPAPGAPDLPVAIGSPMSVYYTAVIENEHPVSRNIGPETYTAPDIHFYEQGDPAIPQYSQIIPLELRPLGAVNVQYTISMDFVDFLDNPFADFETPGTPSVIIGNLSQSVYFVHSVDLYDQNFTALDKTRFMLDTGAQVSVVGKRVGARLNLDPSNPEFLVEIQGVTGDISFEPGFFLDEIRIPALGGWLTFRNVPVVLIDVFSAEGGTLDGIIGMNLFNEFNMVLRGGGLFLTDDPSLELERFTAPPMIGDIAPETPDNTVNSLDAAVMAAAWLAKPADDNWDPRADIAPIPYNDQVVNYLDFKALAEYWLTTP